MRFIYFSILTFSLFSCGEAPIDEIGKLTINGKMIVDSTELLSSSEATGLSKVCTSLLNKEKFFERILVPRGEMLKFSVRQKECRGQIGIASIFTSAIEVYARGLRLLTPVPNGLAEILTTESIALKTYCQQMTSNSGVLRSETYGANATKLEIQQGGTGACSKDKRDICLFFVNGVATENENEYLVKDVERFRVRVDSSSSSDGVVLTQSFESGRTCSNQNEYTITEQSSLSFN